MSKKSKWSTQNIPCLFFSMKFSWRNCSYLKYLPPSNVENDNWTTLSRQQPRNAQNYPKLASDNFFYFFSYLKKYCTKNVHSMSIIGLHVFKITLNDNQVKSSQVKTFYFEINTYLQQHISCPSIRCFVMFLMCLHKLWINDPSCNCDHYL